MQWLLIAQLRFPPDINVDSRPFNFSELVIVPSWPLLAVVREKSLAWNQILWLDPYYYRPQTGHCSKADVVDVLGILRGGLLTERRGRK